MSAVPRVGGRSGQRAVEGAAAVGGPADGEGRRRRAEHRDALGARGQVPDGIHAHVRRISADAKTTAERPTVQGRFFCLRRRVRVRMPCSIGAMARGADSLMSCVPAFEGRAGIRPIRSDPDQRQRRLAPSAWVIRRAAVAQARMVADLFGVGDAPGVGGSSCSTAWARAMGVIYAAHDPQLDRTVALRSCTFRARSRERAGGGAAARGAVRTETVVPICTMLASWGSTLTS